MTPIVNQNITITGTTRGIGKCLLHRLESANRIIELNRPEFNLEKIQDMQNISFKYTDILILNAGSLGIGKCLFSEHYQEDWIRIIQANLVGNLFLIQKYIRQRDSGLIVVLSSMRAAKFTDDALVYSAAKTALSMSVRNLRLELKKQNKNIRLLDVKPSFTKADSSPDPQDRKVSTYDQVADGIVAAMTNSQIEELRF